MAGRARFHALQAELDRRLAIVFEDETDDKTALDYVCERVECGTTTKALALELTLSLPFEVTYARLMAHLRERYGDAETDQRIDAARVRASHLLAEEGLELVDNAQLTAAGVAKASSQAKQRNWMAERYNRERYGSSKGVNVSISVGELHLAALKAAPVRVTGGAQQPITVIAAAVDDSVTR